CQQRALGLAREAIDQVKTLSFTLRPAQLELLGVAMAVRATLEGQLEATGIRGQLRLRGTPPAEVRTSHPVALRILQESLTNVIRHAQARHVLVRLRFMPGGRLALTVADDGRGFDVEATLQGGVAPRNFGLYGMLERAELLGGQLRFRSRPGRGSVVRFLV
ncbi:MAG TPA: ATP-binding protein, partial [Albitalea sp.]|nr:ATP-binding protein [Albitalea sp.]